MQPILNNYDPSPDELNSLHGYIRELLQMAKVLVRIQRKALSLVPSLEFQKLHELYVQISPAVLRQFWRFAAGVQEVVEGRFTGTNLDLSINLNVPELEAFVEELNRLKFQS
jgi:hypothetical protein